MEFKSFLIKYAEIGTKGKNRYVFEDILCKNIRSAMKRVDGRFTVRKEYGRIFVDCLEDYDFDEAVNALQHVFGIVGICPVLVVPTQPWEELSKKIVEFVDASYEDKHFTFKANCRRVNKEYPMHSMDVNIETGAVLLDAFPELKVDVHKPDVMLHIELRDNIYIYSATLPGPGGLPVGTNGKAMLLLSGGIDSPVAGYMVSKRGVNLEAVYFDAPPHTSPQAKQKVVDLARLVSKYSGAVKLHIVHFTDIQEAIYHKCPEDEITIIMRRYMMRIAEILAGENDCQALITGESIGQVASQTIYSLQVTNAVCTYPVFRPCIGMDKQEIVDISEKINTYETSILPYEDCCTTFVAKHPVTKPKLEDIEASETLLADVIDDLMKEALETAEVMSVW
ncbi:MAG: tRNA 4-thiouridine(8) synthase ThiI [Lachnospiraceae bacterium]|nr:tRNA 4-thiouridine(8) synthase ThiI [Lachnospiraceae bacterium]